MCIYVLENCDVTSNPSGEDASVAPKLEDLTLQNGDLKSMFDLFFSYLPCCILILPLSFYCTLFFTDPQSRFLLTLGLVYCYLFKHFLMYVFVIVNVGIAFMSF